MSIFGFGYKKCISYRSPSRQSSTDSLFVIRNVRKSYTIGKKEKKIGIYAQEINLPEGAIIGIIGENGSGKTTFANLVSGLQKPSEGEILFRVGQPGVNSWEQISDFKQPVLEYWRIKNVGIVTQTPNLVPFFSVFDNLAQPLHFMGVPKKRVNGAVNRIIEQFDLASFQKNKPNQLSGGEKQIVAIARAMITKPRLLVADEPTASLSNRNAEFVLQALQRINDDGCTVILISHNLEIIRRYCHITFFCLKKNEENIISLVERKEE